jgi:hypothetical protein
VIRDGIAEGTVKAYFDPNTAATVFWTTTNGLLSLAWRADRLRADADQLSNLLVTATAMLTSDLQTRA